MPRDRHPDTLWELRFTPDRVDDEEHIDSGECGLLEESVVECLCGWAYTNAAINERRDLLRF